MTTQLSTDAEGDAVCSAEGERIGTVERVEDGVAYVDPNSDLDDEFKQQLGWGDDDAPVYPLLSVGVESTEGDTVQLKADL